MRKKWLQETSSGTFPREFFMFVLFFSFNLKLICTCEFFKKLKLHLPKRLVQFQLFENSLVQINSKLNSKPYNYLIQTHWGAIPRLTANLLSSNLTKKSFCAGYSFLATHKILRKLIINLTGLGIEN